MLDILNILGDLSRNWRCLGNGRNLGCAYYM